MGDTWASVLHRSARTWPSITILCQNLGSVSFHQCWGFQLAHSADVTHLSCCFLYTDSASCFTVLSGHESTLHKHCLEASGISTSSSLLYSFNVQCFLPAVPVSIYGASCIIFRCSLSGIINTCFNSHIQQHMHVVPLILASIHTRGKMHLHASEAGVVKVNVEVRISSIADDLMNWSPFCWSLTLCHWVTGAWCLEIALVVLKYWAAVTQWDDTTSTKNRPQLHHCESEKTVTSWKLCSPCLVLSCFKRGGYIAHAV